MTKTFIFRMHAGNKCFQDDFRTILTALNRNDLANDVLSHSAWKLHSSAAVYVLVHFGASGKVIALGSASRSALQNYATDALGVKSDAVTTFTIDGVEEYWQEVGYDRLFINIAKIPLSPAWYTAPTWLRDRIDKALDRNSTGELNYPTDPLTQPPAPPAAPPPPPDLPDMSPFVYIRKGVSRVLYYAKDKPPYLNADGIRIEPRYVYIVRPDESVWWVDNPRHELTAQERADFHDTLDAIPVHPDPYNAKIPGWVRSGGGWVKPAKITYGWDDGSAMTLSASSLSYVIGSYTYPTVKPKKKQRPFSMYRKPHPFFASELVEDVPAMDLEPEEDDEEDSIDDLEEETE